MTRFLSRALGFLLLFSGSFVLLHEGLERVTHTWSLWDIKKPKQAIYVWGDSRTYRGLDLVQLRRLSGRHVISYAYPGAGVYDLHYVVEQIPHNSLVLLGVSFPIMQGKKRFERSGLSFSAMRILQLHGASWSHLFSILKWNRNPLRTVAHRRAPVYPTEPHMTNVAHYLKYAVPEPKNRPLEPNRLPYLTNQTLFHLAIQRLRKKGCTLMLLRFPVAPILHNKLLKMEQYRKAFASFEALNKQKGVHSLLKLKLRWQKNPWFDPSHLNARGQRRMTLAVWKQIQHH
ncbi:MAG: hypothetical protein EP343_03565 [Deltaproteobacteria bacterium]|nr:MAG: hypothetical protein EP343_03565 [Deltaproteobacteria bacterium]